MARSSSEGNPDKPAEQIRQEQLLADFQQVFGSDAGQRVLRHIEEFCELQTDGFDPDPYKMAHITGRRSVGLMILQHLEMSRAEFQEIVRNQYAQSE